jgi:hypothetical protein
MLPRGEVFEEEFVDPPQAARKRLVASAIAKKEVLCMPQPPSI